MEILCEERYQEALDHAEKTNDKSFEEGINDLKGYEANGMTVKLYTDFAPLSFHFCIYNKDDKFVMNGGLIYHGSPDETFSVQLVQKKGWSIHT